MATITTTTTTTASSNWFRSAITITVAVISLTTAAVSVFAFRKKSRDLSAKIKELEISLQSSLEKCAAERQGRIRAQQEVRKALMNDNTQQSKRTSYPMAPIGVVQSCFATRYGAPRQPLVVPIARACLVFDTSQVPPAALEGFAEYSHCWIIYVFHLNTDLEKMWKQPSQSKFKAKVRVPRLKGGRMGVFATRSPHRPCPIGLTVAKVEGVQGNMVLLSGVDLVDGTPVLDIKPYLPYCESIPEALMPEWVTEDNNFSVASINFSHEFSSTLGKCWMTAEEKSLYASPDEIQSLIKQVLQWDIRSLSQRNQPHSLLPNPNYSTEDYILNSEDDREGNVPSPENGQGPLPSPDAVIYHLMVDVLDVSYRIDDDGNVVVGKVTLNPDCQKRTQHQCNYTTWKDVVG